MKRLHVHAYERDCVCVARKEFAPTISGANSRDEKSMHGHVANNSQFSKFEQPVDNARFWRRTVPGGAPREGPFIPLATIANLSGDDPLFAGEQSGPVMPSVKFGDPDDAILQAYISGRRLGGSVRSKDIDPARPVVRREQCGAARINEHGAVQPNVPVGGVKSSGTEIGFDEERLAGFADIPVNCC